MKRTYSKRDSYHAGNSVDSNSDSSLIDSSLMEGEPSFKPPVFNLSAIDSNFAIQKKSKAFLNGSNNLVQRSRKTGNGIIQRHGDDEDVSIDTPDHKSHDHDKKSPDKMAAPPTPEELELFKSKNYGPITYSHKPSGSGFDAQYTPSSGTLNVTVRAAIRFADGLVGSAGSVSSPNSFMNKEKIVTIINSLPAELVSKILPYFQWKDDEKAIHKKKLEINLAEVKNIWEGGGHTLQIKDPGWESIKAKPNINIETREGDALVKTSKDGKLDKQGSDHLQMEVVKKINAADAATVEAMIQEYYDKKKEEFENANPRLSKIYNPYDKDLTNLGTRGVRAYLGNDSNSKRTENSHNNFMSLESNRIDKTGDAVFDKTILFEKNQTELSPESKEELNAFLNNPEIFLDNDGREIMVNLIGFASHEGTSKHNEKVVEKRIASVDSAVVSKIGSKPTDSKVNEVKFFTSNRSDLPAEDEKKTNKDYDPATFRKVELKIERKGRGGQNVLAHEFGHVFGLGDEYEEVGNGYNRKKGDDSTHRQLSKDAGIEDGGKVGNDDRIMSTGNNVEKAHYSTFADALKKLTSKSWNVV